MYTITVHLARGAACDAAALTVPVSDIKRTNTIRIDKLNCILRIVSPLWQRILDVMVLVFNRVWFWESAFSENKYLKQCSMSDDLAQSPILVLFLFLRPLMINDSIHAASGSGGG